jgi:hypothetical protein
MRERGEAVRYDSGPWSRRLRAPREWVLEVVDLKADVTGYIGEGQVLPDELLSVAGLGLRLTPEQRLVLSRAEIASITDWEIRFEAVLEAGFAAQIATAPDLTAAPLTFMLHEMGEETGHQRLFQRLLGQLEPRAEWPIPRACVNFARRWVIHVAARHPAFLYVLVLAGEEITDVFQRAAAEHPGTDPFIRALYTYHRTEEANHVSFARAVYAEAWASGTWLDRFLVRWVAPSVIRLLFDGMVHPGVYETIGLAPWRTWRRVRRTTERALLRREATRPVVNGLIEAGAMRTGKVSRAWRKLSDVDREGADVTPCQRVVSDLQF